MQILKLLILIDSTRFSIFFFDKTVINFSIRDVRICVSVFKKHFEILISGRLSYAQSKYIKTIR